MNSIIKLGGIGLLTLALGCATPGEIKQLSKSTLQNATNPGLGRESDLKELEAFTIRTRDALNETHATATRGVQGVHALLGVLAETRIAAMRVDASLKFEQMAVRLVTVELESALNGRVRPLTEAFAEKLRQVEREKNQAQQASPTSALAAKEYAMARVARDAFLIKALKLESTARKDLEAAVNQARKDYQAEVEATIARLRHTLALPGGTNSLQEAINVLKTQPQSATAYSATFEKFLMQQAEHQKVVSANERKVQEALSAINEYLQSNGYLNLFVADTFKGMLGNLTGSVSALGTKIDKLKAPELVKDGLNGILEAVVGKMANLDQQIPDKVEGLGNKLAQIQSGLLDRLFQGLAPQLQTLVKE